MSLAVSSRTSVLVVAALLWAAPALAQTGSITGRVTDAASGAGLSGAHVEALAASGTMAADAYTDGDGAYRVTGLAAGTYTLRVSLVGYGSKRVEGVRVLAGQSSLRGVQLSPTAFALNPVVVTASRTQEKALDAPATVSVVSPQQIETQPSVSIVDHLRSVPGLDIATDGLISSNVTARGFNNVFSGSLLMLTDNRIASVPSLRVNVPYLVPLTNQDIQRIEVVLGPGAALYGPNAANGVMNVITKSPFESQGTNISIGGGSRSVFQASAREAAKVSNDVAFKVSGFYLHGQDWQYVDSAEVRAQYPWPAGAGTGLKAAGVNPRDYAVERYGGEGRVDVRPGDNTDVVFDVGTTEAGSAIELTGLGAAQARNWRYTYYQARMHHGRLFAQAYLNTSNAGDTYLLRTGNPIVDMSRLFVAQIQHGFDLGSPESLTYGVDYEFTNPRTNGTIDGRNEQHDNISEIGGYIHSVTHLSPKFDLVAAARVDKHSKLKDPVFSPRVALVFKPVDGQNFRITYNRAFSTPTTNNLFLDLIAGGLGQLPNGSPLYNVRTIGVPESGLQFRRDCAGGLCMRSPFSPDPTAYLPSVAVANLWPAVVQIMQQKGIDLSQIPAPTAQDVGPALRILNPTTGTFSDISASDVRDIAALKPTITNTFEVGYKGLIRNRIMLAADVYYERKQDFIGPLNVETPNVFLDRSMLTAYLGRYMSAPEAAQIGAAISGVAGNAQVPGIPLGVVSPDNPLTQAPEVILTYRNFGNLHIWGADLAFEALFGRVWSLRGTYSYMSNDFFPKAEIGGVSDIALNAPKDKASLGLRYRNEASGWSFELRARAEDGFPMNSGVYIGQVKGYGLVDGLISWKPAMLHGLQLSISAQNLLDNKHEEFIGAPAIGRMLLTRLEYNF